MDSKNVVIKSRAKFISVTVLYINGRGIPQGVSVNQTLKAVISLQAEVEPTLGSLKTQK